MWETMFVILQRTFVTVALTSVGIASIVYIVSGRKAKKRTKKQYERDKGLSANNEKQNEVEKQQEVEKQTKEVIQQSNAVQSEEIEVVAVQEKNNQNSNQQALSEEESSELLQKINKDTETGNLVQFKFGNFKVGCADKEWMNFPQTVVNSGDVKNSMQQEYSDLVAVYKNSKLICKMQGMGQELVNSLDKAPIKNNNKVFVFNNENNLCCQYDINAKAPKLENNEIVEEPEKN